MSQMSNRKNDDLKVNIIDCETKSDITDDAVCVCGKKFVVSKAAKCYGGRGVECDQCHEKIANSSNVYHCPANNNNILHTSGYDLCVECFEKTSAEKKLIADDINIDKILFQLWFIVNKLDKSLSQTMIKQFGITSVESFISKSSYFMYNVVKSINWNNCRLFVNDKNDDDNNSNRNNNSSNNKRCIELFYNKFDELRNEYLSLKNDNEIKLVYEQFEKKFELKQKQQEQQTVYHYENLHNNVLKEGIDEWGPYELCKEMPEMGSFGDRYGHTYEYACDDLDYYDDDGNDSNDRNIGFSLGGAKDINSFRVNINNHKIPLVDSITFEGIFGEYYFDTNQKKNKSKNKSKNKNKTKNKGKNQNDIADEKTDHNIETKSDESEINDKKQDVDLPLFYPSYSCSKSIVPSSLWQKNKKNDNHSTMTKQKENGDYENKYDHFLTIGLNSNIKEKDFKRKKLNLVIVLDISGSMGATFDGGSYYWHNSTSDKSKQTKIEIARECILLLLTHLNYDDRFGLILFDTTAEIEIELNEMSSFKLSQFKKMLTIESRDGTDMERGYCEGIKMFNSKNGNNSKYINDNLNYENRMIFLTDARPNYGATDLNSLIKLVSDAANKKCNPNARIYTTFVGIGIDFNSNLISSISNVRGCNYFSVDSKKKFSQKLCDEFDYFVSPMVFNLKLSLFCEGSVIGKGCIDQVFGDTNGKINIENGEIMKIDTLFPSPPSDKRRDAVKGGIVLIKLNNENIEKNKEYFIQTQFEDKFGNEYNNSQQIKFDAILSNDKNNTNKNSDDLSFYANLGVRKGILLVRYVLLMKEWIQSDDNDKKEYYPHALEKFQAYFEREMQCVNDSNLKQEIDIIDELIHW